MRFIFIGFMVLAYLSPASAQQCGTAQATGFDWPLDNWQTNGNDFLSTAVKPYHLGADSAPSNTVIGTAVRSACSGLVREAQSHGGYGGTVIIECFTGTECVSVLAGHMFTRDTTINGVMYRGLQVAANTSVQKGQVIGYIADKANNGGWAPHVHLGIRKGAYQSIHTCAGGWSFAGYGTDCVFDDWYDPDIFIPEHRVARIPYRFSTVQNPVMCVQEPTGGAHTQWVYTCPQTARSFAEGSSAYSLLRIDEVFVDHRFKVVAYRNGTRQWDWVAPWNTVDPHIGWRHAFFWPALHNAQSGNWLFRFYIDIGQGFPGEANPLTEAAFSVLDDGIPYTYLNDAVSCSGPVSGGWWTDWFYTCENQTDTFAQGQDVYTLIRLHNVEANHRYKVEAY
nr:M23 family metallopeptidase [Candidatus Magasanikbacteria bacterium]